MNYKHAEYVMTIVEQGGITAAARVLHISQPSLSQTVKAVESDLGAPLFSRAGNRLTLTPAGRRYVDAVREIMTLEKNLRGEIAEMASDHRATLRIGISASRSVSLLPRILPEFMKRWPLVGVELKESPSVHLEELLEKGGCDIAFITTSFKQNELEYLLVENEQIVLMAAAGTELARRVPSGTEIELDEARDENFVTLTSGHSVRAIQDHLCSRLALSPRVLIEVPGMDAAKLIAAESDAVMICPYGFIQGDPRVEGRVSCYPLRCHGFERHFYFCYPRRLRLTAAMRDLYELARGCCRGHTMEAPHGNE